MKICEFLKFLYYFFYNKEWRYVILPNATQKIVALAKGKRIQFGRKYFFL